jgi:small-conductance mechanosensitive channel
LIKEFLSLFKDPLYSKIIISLLVIIVTIIAALIVRFVFSRWKKALTSRAPQGLSPSITRMQMVQRIVYLVIYLIAAIFILFQIPAVQTIGTTILATAGVVGLIAGLAAQATLANFIAGIAIAFSQPVRLGDSVLYEGEWGWIEDITLMHTVILTWDNRRLVIPNSTLNSSVIQNWTIKDQWLIGVVTMYVDYTCDVPQLRAWAKEIVDASQFSSKERLAELQVVDFTEKSMVIRILCRSWDSGNTWNLRCEIREKMITKMKEAGLPLPEIRISSTDINGLKPTMSDNK